MRAWKFISLGAILVAASGFAAAQQKAATTTRVTVKHVPIRQASAASGKEMFNGCCAVCRGKAGTGDGRFGAQHNAH